MNAAPVPSSPAAVRAALITVQVLFGINYLLSKNIVTVMSPAAWASLRTLAAFVIVAGLALFGRRRFPRGRDLALLAVAALFGVILNQALFLEGLSRTTVGRSALICSQIPTFVLFFSLVSGQERLSLRKGLGFLCGITGVAVLLEADRFTFAAATLQGDLLTVANAASFALFIVLGRRIMERHDPLAATAVVFFFGAVGMSLYGGPALLATDLAALGTATWASMVYVVVGATVVTYFLNLWAIKRAVATRVALYIFLQPVIAATLGVALRGEEITPRFLVATLLVFAALFLRDGRPGPTHEKPPGDA
jgi:drug/metabolite transporter (DMT)-like permease